eukprot:UN09282
MILSHSLLQPTLYNDKYNKSPLFCSFSSYCVSFIVLRFKILILL